MGKGLMTDNVVVEPCLLHVWDCSKGDLLMACDKMCWQKRN